MGEVLMQPMGGGVTSDDVTATKAQVLAGTTALTSDSNDDPGTGTMPNKGAWTSSSSGSGHVAVPAGYHNGSGYVDCSGAYNAGVAAADARINTSSASYTAGYTASQNDLYLGMELNVQMTGTAGNAPSKSSYTMYVVYFDKDRSTICLMGKTRIASANWSTACAYRWTATGTFLGKTFSITNCTIPSLNAIATKTHDHGTPGQYWTNSNYNGQGWFVDGSQSIRTIDNSSMVGVVPRVIIKSE